MSEKFLTNPAIGDICIRCFGKRKLWGHNGVPAPCRWCQPELESDRLARERQADAIAVALIVRPHHSMRFGQ